MPERGERSAVKQLGTHTRNLSKAVAIIATPLWARLRQYDRRRHQRERNRVLHPDPEIAQRNSTARQIASACIQQSSPASC